MDLLTDLSTDLYTAAAIFWICAAPFTLLRQPRLVTGKWRFFLLIAGVLLFLACWHALMAARSMGSAFVLSLLSIVWLADIGAYVIGQQFGSHKLAPTVSPAKTWEGAVGCWLLVIIIAMLAIATAAFAPTLFTVYADYMGWLGALVAITALVIASVVGDLFESLLKRQAGVKDSSALLPGHGGVLDRVDGLIAVLPLALLLLHK